MPIKVAPIKAVSVSDPPGGALYTVYRNETKKGQTLAEAESICTWNEILERDKLIETLITRVKELEKTLNDLSVNILERLGKLPVELATNQEVIDMLRTEIGDYVLEKSEAIFVKKD